jgi:Ca2+-binding RTX toxin-like protein
MSTNRIYSNVVSNARFTSGFSISRFSPTQGIWRPHNGVDLAIANGNPVHSAAAGEVYYAGVINGYGNAVVVAHPSNGAPTSFTLYAHLSSIDVLQDKTVSAGQTLGLSGNSGPAGTGYHVHYEERQAPASLASADNPIERKNSFLSATAINPAENRFGFGTWNPNQIERQELTARERIDQLTLSESEFDAYKARVATLESGAGVAGFLSTGKDNATINYSVDTGNGAYGAFQLRSPALIAAEFLDTAGNWTSRAKGFGVLGYADFVANPQAQDAALLALTNKNIRYLVSHDYDLAIGLDLAAKPITEEGLLLAAHHRPASLGDFINSGGANDAAVGNNPPISSYLAAGVGLSGTGSTASSGAVASPVGHWENQTVYTDLGLPLTEKMVWVPGPSSPGISSGSSTTGTTAPKPISTMAGMTYLSRDGASATLGDGQVINAGPGGRLILESDGGITANRPSSGYFATEGVYDVTSYSRKGQVTHIGQAQVISDPAHPNDPAYNTIVTQGATRDIAVTTPDGFTGTVMAAFQVGVGWVEPETGVLVQSLDAWRASPAVAQDANANQSAFYNALIDAFTQAPGATGQGETSDSLLLGLQLASATDGVMTDGGLMTGYGNGKYITVGDVSTGNEIKSYAGNQLERATDLQIFDDGSTLATTHYATGLESITSTDLDGNSLQVDYTVPGDTNIQSITNRDALGNITATSTITQSLDENFNPIANTYDIVQRDAAGTITATGERSINPTDGSHTDLTVGSITASDPNGTLSYSTTDPAGKTTPWLSKAAQDNLANNVQSFNDTYALIKALQNNQPLPTLTSGVALYNDIYHNAPPELLGSIGTLGALNSLNGLNQALEQGNITGAALSGANAFTQGVNSYVNIAYGGDLINAAGDGLGNVIGAANVVGKAVSYINIANDLAEGNTTAAIADSVGLYISTLTQLGSAAGPVGAVVGIVLGLVLEDLFGDSPPQPWGSASAVWDPVSGTIRINAVGESGGDVAARNALGNLEGSLAGLAQQYNSQAQPDLQIDIIPQRLGGISYTLQGFHVSTIDPTTGAALNANLRFDANSGQAINAEVSDPVYFQSLGQYYINNALARQAIAPAWEVETSRQQFDHALSNAGLSEVERAANLGHLAAALSADATTETWNPIGIDMGGALATSDLSSSPVQFNVDGSASLDARLIGTAAPQYLKQTAWLNGQDGFLVLDKNVNGGIDNAEELFSNSQVNAQSRGVVSLATWDGDGNGKIDASDAVFSQLAVWQDANGDGLLEQGETHHLGDLGLTGLNYQMGTYSKTDGTNDHQMGTLTLQAQTLGHAYTARADGIQIDSSTGQSQLLVTQVHDLSSLQANEDGFATNENLAAVIQVRGDGANVHGLLDNDQVSNAPNAVLSVSSVQNAQNGTVNLDASAGTVTFTPDAGFYGTAGFDYTVNAGAYGQASAHVQVTVNYDDQAPQITGEKNTQIPIYGYSIVTTGLGNGGDSGIQQETIVTPLYQPGYGYATATGGGYGYRDTVVAYETDVYSGAMSVTDVDDPVSALTWSILSQAHHGTASIDNSGHWTFTGAQAVGGNDAFLVEVKDPSGKSDTFAVTVPLPAAPAGETGGGAGDGGYSPPDTASGGISGDVGGFGGVGDTGDTATAPVVLDLAGSGFHFKSIDDSNVFLQSATDGLRHRTAWVEGGNGILAFDKYGDGIVHDSSQIAFKNYLPTAQSDLQGVAAFDSNGDGVVSQDDALWSKLGVWVDADQDGIGDTGEYQSLDASGISSIGLTSDHQFSVNQGVTVKGVSSFTRADGTIGRAADAVLATSSDVLVMNADGTTRVTQVAQADPANPMIVGDGNYLVLGDKGDNVISAGNGNNVISTGAGNDLIQAGNGSNTVLSGDGKDLVVLGAGNNTVMLGAGPKVVIVGKGNNLVTGGPGSNIIMAGNGNNTLYAGSGNSVVYAGHGDNSMVGGAGRNELIAGNGNNLFTDGGGRADMFAGTGSNTFVVTNSLDTITVRAAEGATQGINTVKTQVDWTLGAHQQILWGTGSAALTLTGNDLSNQIIGNGAADTLIGGAGNDALADSGGAATLIGGQGDDTYIVTNAATVVVEDANAGNDTIKSNVSYSLTENVENLILAGVAISGTGNELGNQLSANNLGNTLSGLAGNDQLVGGAGADTLLGGAGSDSLIGNAGADLLDGGMGADLMAGGQGDDSYIVDDAGDLVVEALSEGQDTVTASINYTLTANVEDLILMGAAISGTGNDLDNTLTANDLGNTLSALAGNDWLVGGAGADSLLGGAGSDSLSGNAGADLLDGGFGADLMQGGRGNDTYIVDDAGDLVVEALNEGQDTVRSSIDYTLTANAENLVLSGGARSATGNELDNTLTANDLGNTLSGLAGNDQLVGAVGADTLDGGTEADMMAGGQGDDTYIVDDTGDVVVEALNEGHDTVNASIDYTLTANVEDLILTDASISGTGNELGNQITANELGNTLSGLAGNDRLVGGAGADTLLGGAGSDSLSGNVGADLLDGGTGADVMAGGQGEDSYIVDNAADLVVEQADEGSDTVRSSIDYTLIANVEDLILAGSAIDGTGNQLDNRIDGNELDNMINGGFGADLMKGGRGNDTYVVDDAGDVVVEALNEGHDTVNASIDYTLTANVEDLILTGASVRGRGNDLGNTLTANDLGNTLSALAGNDQLVGGTGVDLLDGGTGADQMAGGLGNDIYIVDDVGDLVVEALNEGQDTVNASVNYALTENVENLILAGAAISGTGNELDNQLSANNLGSILSGLAGNDQLVGGGAADTLLGGAGSDSLTGNAGVDMLDGGTGADVMAGGQGDDTCVVDEAGDLVVEALSEGQDTVSASVDYTLTANVENLVLSGAAISGTGNELDNTLTANDLGNTLSGLVGNDQLVGGAGADTLLGGAGNDSLTGNAGADLLDGGAGADQMAGGLGDDRYIVDDVGDPVVEALNEGQDTVTASVDYTLTANVENLVLSGGARSATGNELDNTLSANDLGNTLSGLSGNDQLVGGAGADTLLGGAGSDSFSGNAGADMLDGGTGADQLAGGQGDDRYIVDDAGDVVVEALNEGHDTVNASIDYTLTANVENLVLSGAAISGTGNELDNTLTANDLGNTLNALAGNDQLAGGSGADTLLGGAGNDSLTGNAGADLLDGGTNADQMTGGLGDDSYIVDDGSDVVVEELSEGQDAVRSSIDYTLTANVEHLILVGAAISGTGNELDNQLTANDLGNTLSGLSGNDQLVGGAGADTLLGGTGSDSLSGNAGTDLLDGGAGADQMAGDLGDDSYIVDDAGDLVVEALSEGQDTVTASVDYTLTANVEHLVLSGGAISGTGNDLDNTLTANDLGNTLSALAGNDQLVGGAGADTLLGGAGSDSLSGNAGSDLLDGDTEADLMAGGQGDDTYIVDDAADQVIEQTAEGSDTVRSSVDYTLTANVENLILAGAAISAIGNELNNTLTANDLGNTLSGLAGNDQLVGGAGADTLLGGVGNDSLSGNVGTDLLDGGAGTDLMAGGLGDDIYIVDDAGDLVVEALSEGQDTVRSSIDYTLTANVENLILLGGAISGSGNDLDNILTANDLGNILSALAGNDQLVGGADADLLDGGTGADLMVGGQGNDIYIVDDVGDAVLEQADEGSDTVCSSIDYTLTANVENLTLIGINAINGNGNELDNTLVGNAAANMLDGGFGADLMQGDRGNDTYLVDDLGDLVVEALNEGQDAVSVSIDYTLTANVEDLILMGAAISGTGNELDNTLTTNDLGNTLNALAGNDQLLGGAGADTLLGGAGGDSITGNAGADLLDGGTGADQMAGGLGDDSYIIDDAADLVVEFFSEGYDQVTASINYVLPEHVEKLVLSGSAISGSGNGLDNLIIGNAQANILDGSSGADRMAGGTGDDRYLVDNSSDAVEEADNAGNDTVYAAVNYGLVAAVENIVLMGEADSAVGNELDNVMVGNSRANRIDAGAGNDVLAGGLGNDLLLDGAGNDTYLWNQGDGRDTVVDVSGIDSVRFGEGISLDSISAREYIRGDERRVFISILDANGEEQPDQGIDYAMTATAVSKPIYDKKGQPIGTVSETVYTSPIELFVLSDGRTFDLEQLKPAQISTIGTNKADTLIGSRADDLMDARSGDDNIYGRTGNDILVGNNQKDRLFGEGGHDELWGGNEDDYLQGGTGNDILMGENGRDILLGGAGDDNLWVGEDHDLLDAGSGNDLLQGGNGGDELWAGAGDDILYGGNDGGLLAAGDGSDFIAGGNGSDVIVAGNGDDTIASGGSNDFIDAGAGIDIIDAGNGDDFIVGGKGDDTLYAGHGNDVIVFNRGDGADTIVSPDWQQDTLSLGGGIRYADITLSKSGSDLILGLGHGDQITLKAWYDASSGQNDKLARLQLLTASTGGDYDPSSEDLLLNDQVLVFDLSALASQFDQWRMGNANLTTWSAEWEMRSAYLSGSDTQAIGGDLAYRYALFNDANSQMVGYGDFDWKAVQNQMSDMGVIVKSLTASTFLSVNPWVALQAGTSLILEEPTGASLPINLRPPLTQDELLALAMNTQQQLTGQNRPSWS